MHYSSPRGGYRAHHIENGLNHYEYNVSAEFDNFRGEKLLREDVYEGLGRLVKTQNLKEADGVTIKTNRVTYFPNGLHTDMSQAQSIQIVNEENGLYSVIRKNNAGEIVSGYEMKLNPKTTFAEGFAGKLQRFAFKIAHKTGEMNYGQERPILGKIGGLLFDLARKIR